MMGGPRGKCKNCSQIPDNYSYKCQCNGNNLVCLKCYVKGYKRCQMCRSLVSASKPSFDSGPSTRPQKDNFHKTQNLTSSRYQKTLHRQQFQKTGNIYKTHVKTSAYETQDSSENEFYSPKRSSKYPYSQQYATNQKRNPIFEKEIPKSHIIHTTCKESYPLFQMAKLLMNSSDQDSGIILPNCKCRVNKQQLSRQVKKRCLLCGKVNRNSFSDLSLMEGFFCHNFCQSEFSYSKKPLFSHRKKLSKEDQEAFDFVKSIIYKCTLCEKEVKDQYRFGKRFKNKQSDLFVCSTCQCFSEMAERQSEDLKDTRLRMAERQKQRAQREQDRNSLLNERRKNFLGQGLQGHKYGLGFSKTKKCSICDIFSAEQFDEQTDSVWGPICNHCRRSNQIALRESSEQYVPSSSPSSIFAQSESKPFGKLPEKQIRQECRGCYRLIYYYKDIAYKEEGFQLCKDCFDKQNIYQKNEIKQNEMMRPAPTSSSSYKKMMPQQESQEYPNSTISKKNKIIKKPNYDDIDEDDEDEVDDQNKKYSLTGRINQNVKNISQVDNKKKSTTSPPLIEQKSQKLSNLSSPSQVKVQEDLNSINKKSEQKKSQQPQPAQQYYQNILDQLKQEQQEQDDEEQDKHKQSTSDSDKRFSLNNYENNQNNQNNQKNYHNSNHNHNDKKDMMPFEQYSMIRMSNKDAQNNNDDSLDKQQQGQIDSILSQMKISGQNEEQQDLLHKQKTQKLLNKKVNNYVNNKSSKESSSPSSPPPQILAQESSLNDLNNEIPINIKQTNQIKLSKKQQQQNDYEQQQQIDVASLNNKIKQTTTIKRNYYNPPDQQEFVDMLKNLQNVKIQIKLNENQKNMKMCQKCLYNIEQSLLIESKLNKKLLQENAAITQNKQENQQQHHNQRICKTCYLWQLQTIKNKIAKIKKQQAMMKRYKSSDKAYNQKVTHGQVQKGRGQSAMKRNALLKESESKVSAFTSINKGLQGTKQSIHSNNHSSSGTGTRTRTQAAEKDESSTFLGSSCSSGMDIINKRLGSSGNGRQQLVNANNSRTLTEKKLIQKGNAFGYGYNQSPYSRAGYR